MKNLRIVLTINDEGKEVYLAQAKGFIFWYTQFKSFDKQEANNVYFKIAKSSNINV